jgi:hypothetical protein
MDANSDQVTTNVRLPRSMWNSLKQRALRDNTSMSELLREGALYVLEERAVYPAGNAQTDPFMSLVGVGSGSASGSSAHDAVYEDKDLC